MKLKQKTREEILVGVLGENAQPDTELTIAQLKQADYNDVIRKQREACQSLAMLEAQIKFDNMRLATSFHKKRTGAEAISGTITSVIMGAITGVIAAILDGAAVGISLVAPAVAFPIAAFVISLGWQTVTMTAAFSWTLAGQMAVISLWRALIVLVGTLAAIGVVMWWQNRVDREVISSYRNSYMGDK